MVAKWLYTHLPAKVINFLPENQGVVHTTLDPQGPGVLRLHLLPPKSFLRVDPQGKLIKGKTEALLWINGFTSLPLDRATADLVRVFIEEVNLLAGPQEELDNEDFETIKSRVSARMKWLYPFTRKSRFANDLALFLDMCLKLAQGEKIQGLPNGLAFEDSVNLGAPHRMDLIIANMDRESNPHACPCHCAICYAEDEPGIRVPEISTQEWKTIIDKLWDAGVTQLTFTGGEPTEREDLFILIDHARRFVTRLNTCGHKLVDPEYVALLKAVSLDNVQFTIYSDETHARQHDMAVGHKGGWAKTVAGIKNCIAQGVWCSANVPLVTWNIDHFSDTLRYLHSLGLRYVTCSSIIPTGNAIKPVGEKRQITAELLQEKLAEAAEVAREIGIELRFTHPTCTSQLDLASIGLETPTCGASVSNMAVMPNGHATHCQSWLLSAEGLGNLLTHEWEEIWNHPEAVKLRTPSTYRKCTCGLTHQCGCPLHELKEAPRED